MPKGCSLCPRACGVVRSADTVGVCGVGREVRLARAALHEWEEPCISVGAGSGAVFFSGCPLHCVYCQNAEISDGKAGTDIPLSRMTAIFLELQQAGAANINLVTPTQYTDEIIIAIHDARQQGLDLPIVWNTSGYESVETVERLAGTVDIFLTDFKYRSADLAARLSHAPDYPDVAFAALRAMVDVVGEPTFDTTPDGDRRLRSGVVVRQLLLPGCVDDAEDVLDTVWDAFGTKVLYSLMNQYTPLRGVAGMPELSHTVDPAEYEELLDFADGLGIPDYFWQSGGAARQSFIPPFDGTGV